MIDFFTVGYCIVAMFAAICFISFMCSICCSLYTQHFAGNENTNRWLIRFNFAKNLFWQWTIYLFAAISLIHLIFGLIQFVGKRQ